MSLPRSWVDLQPDAIRVEHASPQYPNGQRGLLPDGRQFRYAKAGGTALVAGRLYQSGTPTDLSNFANLAVPAAVAAGATEVTVTNGGTALTENQFTGGYALVEAADGAGFLYQVARHNAAAGAAAVVLVLENGEALVEALTTSSKVTLVPAPNSGVIIHPSPPTFPVAGVAVNDLGAGKWGWLQTRGPAGVLQQGTIVAGEAVIASTSTDGAVAPFALTEGAPNTGAGQQVVGWALRSAGNGNVGTVYLTID